MKHILVLLAFAMLFSCSNNHGNKPMLAIKTNSDKSKTPLTTAIQNKDLEKVLDIIDMFVNSNIDEFKASISQSNLLTKNDISLSDKIVELILHYGKQIIGPKELIDLRDLDNNTLLLYAISKQNKKMIKILIKLGLKIYGIDKIKAFQLHWIVKNFDINYIRTYKILKTPSLNIELKDKKGDTLLHWADENNEIDKAKLLVIDYMHSTKVKDKKGLTPLKSSKKNSDVYIFLKKRNKSSISPSFYSNYSSSYSSYGNESTCYQCGSFIMNKYSPNFGFNKCIACGAFL